MSRIRRQYTSEQKATLLRRHLVDKVPVSDICNQEHLQPSLFYGWLRQAFENLHAALVPPKGPSQEQVLARQVDALEKKLAQKDAVIAEVTQEYVQAKKGLREVVWVVEGLIGGEQSPERRF